MKYAAVVGPGNFAQRCLGKVHPVFRDRQGYEGFVDSEHQQQAVYDPAPTDKIMVHDLYDYVVLEIEHNCETRHRVEL